MFIIFLGPPGAGKGTQAKILSRHLKIPHLSTGEILRKISNKENETGIFLKNIIKKGLLVSDEIITELVKNRINMADCKNGYILDGFPRTIAQALSLESLLNIINQKINIAIQIDVPEEILFKRITGRETCPKCLAVYNKFFNPMPKEGCNNCGSKKNSIIRSDDREDAFKNVRLKKYNDETRPLIDFYKKKGILQCFNGIGSTEEISNNIIKYLQTV